MLTIGVSKLAMTEEAQNSLYITYWGESIALWAFGVAWIVAGKVISPLVDDEEKLKLNFFGK